MLVTSGIAWGQTTEGAAAPATSPSASVSLQAQQVIRQVMAVDTERAKAIARSRRFRKQVGRFGNQIGYKAASPTASSARLHRMSRAKAALPSVSIP
jgi:hypothetical protein